MATLDNKSQILQKAGYTYNFDREVYFNRRTKKVFSLEFIEDHSEGELKEHLDENKGAAGWRFYFNSEPSAGVKREIESVLE
jgi:hypothetical protein